MFSSSFQRLHFEKIPVGIRRPLRNGAIAGVVVAVFSLFLPNQYRAEVRILPADSRSAGGGGQMAAAAAAVGVAVPGQEGSDSAFVDIVNSRWAAKKLLMESFQFSTRSWMYGRPLQHQETLHAYLKAGNVDQGARKLKGMLSVTRDLKSKLLTLSAESDSPELSQQLVKRAAKHLEDFVQKKAQSRGGNKAAFTAERMKEAQAECNRAEQDTQAFLDVHRNYTTSNDPAIRMKGNRLETTLKLRQQVVTTLTLNYEQALLEEKNDMPILNILDEGDLPMEKSGPARSRMVLTFAVVAMGLTILWEQRAWIQRWRHARV